jgi:hypothetical protein
MDCVESPVDHKYVALGSVPAISVILSPLQNASLPDILATGAAGREITIEPTSLPPQLVTLTLYVPAEVTIIEAVTAPVDQRYDPWETGFTQRVTESPLHIVVLEAVTMAVGGLGVLITTDATLDPPQLLTVTE